MSTGKKKLLLNTTAVNLGCSSCRRIKLSKIFHPKPKYKSHHHPQTPTRRRSSSTSWTTTPTTATTFSPNADDVTPTNYSSSSYDTDESDVRCLTAVQGFGRIGGDSLAVEKDSDDPYLDFRQSMLQMILEKEIYSKQDLRELLNCFLQLNSPYHHGIIIRAFTEIWNGVFSLKMHGQGQQHFPRDY